MVIIENKKMFYPFLGRFSRYDSVHRFWNVHSVNQPSFRYFNNTDPDLQQNHN